MNWIGQQKALTPDKPFFVYFAPGATHAPHHVPKEWADKYKGKFDAGWDKLREETFARQKALGVIPPDCRAHRPPQGDSGMGRHAGGAEAGASRGRWRFMRASWSIPTTTSAGSSTRSKKLDILDDTLIYYIIGDNGASAEGTLNGTFNEMLQLQRHGGARDAGIPHRSHRPVRRPEILQPLRRRLGARDGHALSMDEAGRFALGRDAQRHDRSLAEGHPGEGRDPLAISPRHRRRPDDPRGGGPSRAESQ